MANPAGTRWRGIAWGAGLAAAWMAAVVQAQGNATRSFIALDRDEDGVIDRAEARRFPLLLDYFAQVDTNADDTVDRIEFGVFEATGGGAGGGLGYGPGAVTGAVPPPTGTTPGTTTGADTGGEAVTGGTTTPDTTDTTADTTTDAVEDLPAGTAPPTSSGGSAEGTAAGSAGTGTIGAPAGTPPPTSSGPTGGDNLDTGEAIAPPAGSPGTLGVPGEGGGSAPILAPPPRSR